MSLADRVLARAWGRTGHRHREPEGFLEDALGMVLESTDAWPRLVRHFGWPVPVGPFRVSAQDSSEAGRTDLLLSFADGARVVLELKAGPAPGEEQVARYAKMGPTVIGLATTPRRYAHARVVGSTTWADLVQLPWVGPPLPWRQFVQLTHALGVAMTPVDVSALMGLQAAFDAQATVDQWAIAASDRLAKRLTGDGATWVTRQGKRGRRYVERAYRRQVAWAWPYPWKAHPYAGVSAGLYMGHPSLPLLAAGLPDLRVFWQARPGEALHAAIAADPQMIVAASKWVALPDDGTVRAWQPTGWGQLSARRSSASLLGVAEPGKVFADWVERVMDEWEQAGVTAALRRLVLPATDKLVDDEGPPDVAEVDGPGGEA